MSVDVDVPLGEREQAAAWSSQILGELRHVPEGGLVARRPLVVHLGHVGRVARLDRGDELLLTVAEGGPVELHLYLPLRRPALNLLGQNIVAGGDIAFEEPYPQLGRALRPRHALERLESSGGAARDDGGLA